MENMEIEYYTENSEDLALACGRAALEKIAKDVIIIDISDIEFAVTDYFIICGCDSETQLAAVVDNIQRKVKDEGYGRPRIEGLDARQWALLDYFNVVVHVMLNPIRSFYKLEKLWADGKFFILDENGLPIGFPTSDIVKLYVASEVLEPAVNEEIWDFDDEGPDENIKLI